MFDPYPILQLSDIERFEDAVAKKQNVVLLKKSPSCYISKSVLGRLEKLWDIPSETVPLFIVDVKNQRPLSQALEKITGVIHESPQCILYKNQKVHWHVSHHEIEYEELKEILHQ